MSKIISQIFLKHHYANTLEFTSNYQKQKNLLQLIEDHKLDFANLLF